MKDLIPTERIEQAIFLIRGQKVLLDADLALIYGVPTKVLNQAVKRNLRRFPSDFVFRLTAEELEAIQSQIAAGANRSQIVTGSQKHRDPRTPRRSRRHHRDHPPAGAGHPRAPTGSSATVQIPHRLPRKGTGYFSRAIGKVACPPSSAE
jgi:hypothetical protein